MKQSFISKIHNCKIHHVSLHSYSSISNNTSPLNTFNQISRNNFYSNSFILNKQNENGNTNHTSINNTSKLNHTNNNNYNNNSTNTSNNTSNNTSSTNSNHINQINNINNTNHSSNINHSNNTNQTKIFMPRVGQSTGDKYLDDAIKKWRQTNTPDDEKFKKLFQKSESGLIKTLLERKADSLKEYSVSPKQGEIDTDIIEKEHFQNPSQPNEHNGPKGPEPTRYGDWERRGRTFDF